MAFPVPNPPKAARKPRLALACAMLVVGAFGCRERQGSPLQRFEAVATSGSAPGASAAGPLPAAGPARDLFTRSTLTRVMTEIRQRVGDATSALMLELTPDHATIQIEAPSRPGSIVQYEWDEGTLRGPIPVELRGSGALESNLFPLSSVDLGEIPELAKAAVERIDREHGHVERIVVRRNLPVDEAVGIRVYVKSPIRSSHVDADARGRIAETPRIP